MLSLNFESSCCLQHAVVAFGVVIGGGDMDNAIHCSLSALTLSTWLLLQLLTLPQAALLPALIQDEEEDMMASHGIVQTLSEPLHDPLAAVRFGLQTFTLCPSFDLLDDDIRYWVKPRSTTWFSRFFILASTIAQGGSRPSE